MLGAASALLCSCTCKAQLGWATRRCTAAAPLISAASPCPPLFPSAKIRHGPGCHPSHKTHLSQRPHVFPCHRCRDKKDKSPLDLALDADKKDASLVLLEALGWDVSGPVPRPKAAAPPPPQAQGAGPSAPPMPAALLGRSSPLPAVHATPPPSPPPSEPANECVICCDARREVALIPCGHRSMCNACADQFFKAQAQRRCPVCRGKVKGSLRVFDP